MSDSNSFTLRRLTRKDASGVCELYRTIYGEDFPLEDVYDPQKIWKSDEDGQKVTVVALSGDGEVIGQGAAARSPENSRLYEMVGLMVLPRWRKDGVAGGIATYLVEDVFPDLDWQARFTESTAVHVGSQRVDLAMGHLHCALRLDLLPGRTYGHDPLFGKRKRASCIMSFCESGEGVPVAGIPSRYEGELEFLYDGLANRERKIFEGVSTAERTDMGSFVFDDAGAAYLSVRRGGCDLADCLQAEVETMENRNIASIQLQIDMADPALDTVVEEARNLGFSFGGLLPRWFDDGDGLLLQRTANRPAFEEICVLPGRGEVLLEAVRTDWKSVQNKRRNMVK